MSNVKKNAATQPFVSPPAHDERKIEIPCSMIPFHGAQQPYTAQDYMCTSIKRIGSSFTSVRNGSSGSSFFMYQTPDQMKHEETWFYNAFRRYNNYFDQYWDGTQWDEQVTMNGVTFNPDMPPLNYSTGINPRLIFLKITPRYKSRWQILQSSYIKFKDTGFHEITRTLISFNLQHIPTDAEIIDAKIRIPWIWPDSLNMFSNQDGFGSYEPLPFFQTHPRPSNFVRIVPASFNYPIQLSNYSTITFEDIFPLNNNDRYLYYTPENIKSANSSGLQYIQDSLASGMLKLAILNEADFLEDQSVCPPIYEPPNGGNQNNWHPQIFTDTYDYLYGAQLLFRTSGETVPFGPNYHLFSPANDPSIEITYKRNF
jgi:hypothetical protein